ncbi:serine hydrolase [Microbacterium sp. EST19A]|uniref:serine hydrolase n=1 Tax=Microbacterium sp. EST19A TaxID=2862681 RepID=UPI001CBB9CF4|nr:serine hydrolase [Microbacterium sp. EST19A]
MTRRMSIDDALALTVPSQPALSPAGDRVVYVLGGTDAAADKSTSALWIAEDGATRALTRGTSDSSPVFSPDGAHVAFLRDGQLWTLPLAGGEPQQRTTLPLGAGSAVWSPDGTKIAFTASVVPLSAPSDAVETDEQRAEREKAPIATAGIDYLADGAWFTRGVSGQLHVLDIADGQVRRLTDGVAGVGSPAWSPDGSTLAYVARPRGTDDLGFRSAVHALDPADPAARSRVLAFAEGFAGTVSFTPDGESLLVVGWNGEPDAHAGLFRVDLGSGDVTDLAASLDRNVMPGAPAYPGALPQVTASGDVLFAIRDRGATHLYAVPVGGGTPRHVHGGTDEVVSGLSVSGDVAAIALSTPTSFGEILRLDLAGGDATTLTAHGAAPEGVELFVRESREFTISDGTVVQGWIVRDPAVEGATPLLVDVHGGPHNSWNGAVDEMHVYHQQLAADGWTIVMINPRGSDGYGEEFWKGVNGAWGVDDAKDFLEPIDELVAEGTADAARLAVAGYSYGGYMSAYLTGHDDRFAAAVTGGIVADLFSMGGSSDDAHLLSLFEVGIMPWQSEGRERLAAMSPYSHVEHVTTPTLVLHGEKDLRCPVHQAQQWHYALREREVPTELVIYPGGSHVFPLLGAPSHRVDYARRIVEWVERFAGSTAGARPAAIDAAHWQHRLDALAALHGVPGAELGILRFDADGGHDDVVTVATGTLNRNLPAASGTVLTDSLFQIGSISKVWTATAIMRLIEQGSFTLDTPVREILPGVRLVNDELTAGVTVRHLLTHTSGIDGDVFTDTGRGDDTLEKYTALFPEIGQNHPLGATWSYCNSGFSLLGRIIEQATGKVWDEAMRELIFTPLGLTHTVTLPEEAILHSAAVGHVDVGDESVIAPVWALPRSLGPAGLITARAEDVLAFARLHLAGGVAADGTRLLSEDTVSEMQAFHAEVPDKHVLGDSWGLGWIRFDWNGERLYGHDGNTIGQAAFLRIHEPSGVAVTLLTNGGHTRDLYQDLYREIFAELSDVQMQESVQPPAEPVDVDITPYVGTYERASVRAEVFVGDDGPVLRTTVLGPLAELEPDPVDEYPLTPFSDGVFALRAPGTQTWMTATFYTLPTGEEYLHFGARATPKVSTGA